MRLIDADALERNIREDVLFKYFMGRDVHNEDLYMTHIHNVIELQPTIEPMTHGHWEKWGGMMPPEYTGKHFCSQCGGHCPHDYGHEKFSPWCPGCGAKMDEEVQHETD